MSKLKINKQEENRESRIENPAMPEKELHDRGSRIMNHEEDLEDCQIKLLEAEERYKRVLADYRNLEYQVGQDRQQYIKMANRMLIENLLEPIDFMETATRHIEDKGLQMVVDRFYQVLNMEGLEEIPVQVGQNFDEKTMEAVDTTEGEENKVMEIKQKGFHLNGTVIRHAKVVVGKQM